MLTFACKYGMWPLGGSGSKVKAASPAKNLPRGSGGGFPLFTQARNLLRPTYSYSKKPTMKTPLAQLDMEVKCGSSFTLTLQWKTDGCHQMAAYTCTLPPFMAHSFFLFKQFYYDVIYIP